MLRQRLEKVARYLIPHFDQFTALEQLSLLRDLLGCIFSLPIVIFSLTWLITITEINARQLYFHLQTPTIWVFLGFALILSPLSFFQLTGNKAGRYSLNSANLSGVVIISTILTFGVWGVWLHLIGLIYEHYFWWRRLLTLKQKWNFWRNILYNFGTDSLKLLIFLTLYQQFGGLIPLTSLRPQEVWPALAAVLIYIPLASLFFIPLIAIWELFDLRRFNQYATFSGHAQFLTFWVIADTPAFFGILATATYQQMGLVAYIFLMTGIVLMAFLARRLSEYAVTSQQQARELSQLEQFSHHLLAAPPDASTLTDILAQHFPNMFEYYQVEIRLLPETHLLHLPSDHPLLPEIVWIWFFQVHQARPASITPPQNLPWAGQPATQVFTLLPILSTQTNEPIGGICLVREPLSFVDVTENVLPVLQNLAAQVASTLHSAELYRHTLGHQKMAQELAFAGQIQASFLPRELPHIKGWQLAAMLKPARETSGDFYDVLQLSDGNFGLIMADVADKGMGAALFMAMSRTLLRTYAFVYPDRPDLVLHFANQRILTDSHSKLFVTVFYGVLNPDTGQIVFANGGHVPPYLLRAAPPHEAFALRNTGMPLGVLESATWYKQIAYLMEGDYLLLYTDGLTEASNAQDQFFGASRLLELTRQNLTASALELQTLILAAAQEFTDDHTQPDDLSLMVLRKSD